jgi:hypothetical protein
MVNWLTSGEIRDRPPVGKLWKSSGPPAENPVHEQCKAAPSAVDVRGMFRWMTL